MKSILKNKQFIFWYTFFLSTLGVSVIGDIIALCLIELSLIIINKLNPHDFS
jgi:hypothetical protein